MAEELKTVLGFEASGAINTLNSLTTSINAYNKALFQSTIITQKYNQVARNVDAQLKKQKAATASAATAQTNLATQSKKSAKAVKNVGERAASAGKNINRLGKDAKKSGQQMILTWQSVIRIFTIQVIHQMISKITSALSESAEAARKFEIGIAEVETIASSVGLSFEQLAEQAIRAATAIGQPLDVVVEAQYQLFSNQVGNAVESLMAFEAAQRLSIAGVTPLNDAVALVTGTLNAYGKSASEADTIAAKLFKTVELGRVRINEMGDTLGRITVMGAQLGVSLDAILASIATLTIQGVKANDAMTQILNVQLKLIRPTDAMKDAFAELGVTSAEAGIQAYGFQGFLLALTETTSGTATEIGELFGRVRATRGALGLAGRATEKYNKNLEAIKEATSELLTEKLELIFETNAKQVEIELNRLNIQVTEGIGRGLNVVLKETFDLFGGAAETLQTLGVATSAAAVTFLVLRSNILYTIANMVGLSVASDVATKKIILLRTASAGATLTLKGLRIATLAFLATPMGAAIAMAAVIGGIAFAYQRATAAAREHAEELRTLNEGILKQELKNASRRFEARREVFEHTTSTLQQHLTQRVKLEIEAARKSKLIEDQLHKSITEQIGNRTAAIKNYSEGVLSIIDKLNSKLKDLREDSRGIATTIEAFKFERKTKGMDDIETYYANIKKSQDLRYKAQSAIRKGEVELGKTINEQAQQYATQALEAADASKNRTLVWRAEENKIDILKDQLDFNRQIARQEQVRAAVAKKAAPGLFAQVTNLQSLTNEYKDIGTKLSDIETTDEDRIKHLNRQLILASKIGIAIARFAKREEEAKILGLEEPFKRALKEFREPLTGVEMDLSSIVLFDSERIAKTLQVSLNKVSKKVYLKAFELTGEKTAIEQQKALVKSGEELDKNKKEQEKIITAQHTTNTIIGRTKGLTAEVTNELKKQETVATKIARIGQFILGPPGPGIARPEIGYDPGIKQIETLATEIANLIVKGEDIDLVNTKLIELRAINFNITQQGMISVANSVEAVITNLEEGRDAFVTLKDNKDVDLTATISAFNTAGAAAEINAAKVNRFEEALKRVRDQQLLQAPVQGKSLGGMVYRQYGGFTPRGTDTIPAMLSPGEFVVNAKSSKQFFSQLVAINSGIKPVYKQEGGMVTNVGDVNINVTGAPTPQQTARETMSAFRREMRRRTSSLGDS